MSVRPFGSDSYKESHNTSISKDGQKEPDKSKILSSVGEETLAKHTVGEGPKLNKLANAAVRVVAKEVLSSVSKNQVVNSVATGLLNSSLEAKGGYKTQVQQNNELLNEQSDLIQKYLLKEIENYTTNSQDIQKKLDMTFEEIVSLYKETKDPQVIDSFVMGTLGCSLLFSLIYGTNPVKKANPIRDIQKVTTILNNHLQEKVETTTSILNELGEKLLAAQKLPNMEDSAENVADLQKYQATLTTLKPLVDLGLLAVFSRTLALAPALSASPLGAVIGPALLVSIISNSIYRSAGVKEHIYKIEGKDVVVDTKREIKKETMKSLVGSGIGSLLKSQTKGIQMTGKILSDILGDFLFPKNMNSEEKKKLTEDSIGILFALLHDESHKMQIEDLKNLIQSTSKIYSRLIENEKDPLVKKKLGSIINESLAAMENELSDLISSISSDKLTEKEELLLDLQVDTVKSAIAYNLAKYRLLDTAEEMKDVPQETQATPRGAKSDVSAYSQSAQENESIPKDQQSVKSLEKLIPEMLSSLKVQSFNEALNSIIEKKSPANEDLNIEFFETTCFIEQQIQQVNDLCVKYSSICDSEQMSRLQKTANLEIEKLERIRENLIDLFSDFQTIPISENGLTGDLINYKIECDKIKILRNLGETYQILDSRTKSKINGLLEKLDQRADGLRQEAETLLRKDLASKVSRFSKTSTTVSERVEVMFEVFRSLNEFKSYLDGDSFEFSNCFADCDLKDLAIIENDLNMYVESLSVSVLSVSTSSHLSSEGLETLTILKTELKNIRNNIKNYGGVLSNKNELISLIKKSSKKVTDSRAVYQEEGVNKLKKLEKNKRDLDVIKLNSPSSKKSSGLLYQKLQGQQMQKKNAIGGAKQKKISIPRLPKFRK